MSGGGLRSAAVNINTDKKPRREVDAELFADAPDWKGNPPAYQQHLRANYVTFTNPEYGVGLVSNLTFSPINFLLNGVFGWHANTSPMRRWYENRLRRTFQYDPLGHGEADPHMMDLKELADSGYGLPWPIINSTALIEKDLKNYGARLGNVVFQFTPGFYGSDAFNRHGYKESETGKDFTLARVVSISSAAFDGASLVSGPAQSTWWSLLNLDTGLYVNNPNRRLRTLQRFLPWPLYYFNNYLRDVSGTDIYLSDGGHAENLGVYALVRRGCGRLIIVDAEHDPTFIFDAYRRLQNSLQTEMGVSLAVKDIETSFPLALWADTDPVRVDGPRWRAAAAKPVMEGHIAQMPISKESGHTSADRLKIPVLYVKMAYHAEDAKDPGPLWEQALERKVCPARQAGTDDTSECAAFRRRRDNVRSAFFSQRALPCRFSSRTDDYGQMFEACPFPHRSTRVQAFSEADYDAWRDLGRLLIDAHEQEIREFVETR